MVGKHYRFTVIDDKVLRYEWAEDGVFEDRASTFAINRKFPKPEFRVEETEDQLDIITPAYHLTYDKKRFSPNGFSVTFYSKLTERGDDWRYGQPTEDNLGGTARTLDGVNGRCDMGTGIISRAGYATLDDSTSMLFDGKGFVTPRPSGDRIDEYLFAYGDNFKGGMKSFYAISGSQPAVPRWCLGNWWSRYHAYDQAGYLALMDKFKAKDIPLSVAVIDMDWHLVTGDNIPHAGWSGYTWNRELFPDPEGFTKELHDRKLKITLNDHPALGVHHHEEMYEEFAEVMEHDTTHKTPILFDPTSPKFLHAALNTLYRKIEDQGCDFWWIDWQQGAFSKIPGFDPLWLLNHFHYIHQVHNKTPSQALIFSRYAGPGSHRYPIGFSGDTDATWDSLEFQPEFTNTASNIGYGWWSHDIGGHIGGVRDDELNVRWTQYGVLSPIMRLHSSNSRWQSKEPWLYRAESEGVIQQFMQFRHRLIPYLYSVSIADNSSNLPLTQPLYWNHPLERSAYLFPNQYYFGSNLVIAPVVTPRDKRTNLAKTRVWVPPSRHVDILTGTVYDGDQEINMYRPLSRLPILAAEGSIIPLDKESVPLNGCPNPKAFEVLVVVGKDGVFHIRENIQDDEDSQTTVDEQRKISISYDQAKGRLLVDGSDRDWSFRFVSSNIQPSNVKLFIGSSASSALRRSDESVTMLPNLVIAVSKKLHDGNQFGILLGPNPQLTVLDHSQTISDLLLDFQISPWDKDKIWRIIESSQATTVKLGRLLGLGLDEVLIGPIVELLLADSRS